LQRPEPRGLTPRGDLLGDFIDSLKRLQQAEQLEVLASERAH
jgi:hypothetical protein